MRSFFSLIVLLGFLACEEQAEEPTFDRGESFYPVQSGLFWVYEVEEIDFGGDTPDTLHYFLKEAILDSIISGNGTVTHFLFRHKTPDTTLAWEVDSVWTIRKEGQRVVVTEHNIPLVKLVFPAVAGTRWNGHALNTLIDQTFYYEEVDAGTASRFASTPAIRVVMSDVPPNLVNQDERSEVYVSGIGLVEKDYIRVDFCQSNCPAGSIESGRILRQVLVKYGEE